jgi:hypothetical protein
MGRKKKYSTLEEKKAAQNKWAREYYERNKEIIDNKAKEKYNERKRNNLQDNKFN